MAKLDRTAIDVSSWSGAVELRDGKLRAAAERKLVGAWKPTGCPGDDDSDVFD